MKVTKKETTCQYCERSTSLCKCYTTPTEKTGDVCFRCEKPGQSFEGRTHKGVPVVDSFFIHEECGGMPYKEAQ